MKTGEARLFGIHFAKSPAKLPVEPLARWLATPTTAPMRILPCSRSVVQRHTVFLSHGTSFAQRPGTNGSWLTLP
jgi:hypothetical protein